MPRPTPQTFARRLGLQAIMWGLFVAAMVGAWQLSRVRDQRVLLPPLAPAKRFGDLLIAVPTGWETRVIASTMQLLVIEPANSHLHRELIITEQQLVGPPTGAFIADQLHGAQQITDITFAGLHAKGKLTQGLFEDERTGAVTQEYDAFVYLPVDNLAVTVELRGVPGFRKPNRQNFQSIIDHLQLVPVAPPKQIIQPNAGPLAPIGQWRRLTPQGNQTRAPRFPTG